MLFSKVEEEGAFPESGGANDGPRRAVAASRVHVISSLCSSSSDSEPKSQFSSSSTSFMDGGPHRAPAASPASSAGRPFPSCCGLRADFAVDFGGAFGTLGGLLL